MRARRALVSFFKFCEGQVKSWPLSIRVEIETKELFQHAWVFWSSLTPQYNHYMYTIRLYFHALIIVLLSWVVRIIDRQSQSEVFKSAVVSTGHESHWGGGEHTWHDAKNISNENSTEVPHADCLEIYSRLYNKAKWVEWLEMSWAVRRFLGSNLNVISGHYRSITALFQCNPYSFA